MKLPNNKTIINIENDCIRVQIDMIHPKWVSNILFFVFFIMVLILIVALGYFELLRIAGPIILFPTTIWLFFAYRVGKAACWHRYGQENYLLADLAFSHQRSYGVYTSELESVTSVDYQIGFQETSDPNSPKTDRMGLLIFYSINPITKIESILFESALEMSLNDYEIILLGFSDIRNQNNSGTTTIFLN